MRLRLFTLSIVALFLTGTASASRLFIPMDATGQTNHLKAYGVAFAAMQSGIKVDWLLNYKGGSFGMDDSKAMEQMCQQRGVSFKKLTNKEYSQIVATVNSAAFNGQIVQLAHAPRIAVYTPLNKEPWDDAVTLALTYAGIPFDKLYADEVLAGDLDKYDWLHLHHEDFTGQYGKFWVMFRNAQWYKEDVMAMEACAAKHGYNKVSQLQLAVVKKIKDFVGAGGNMFAMCSATETFDIALAADGLDICESQFDGDPLSPDAQQKLDYSKCFAFEHFKLEPNSYVYSHSDIDSKDTRQVAAGADNFNLIAPPGKMDVVPVMLCQNHTNTIKGFMGQTTAFRKDVIKPNVMILGDRVQAGVNNTSAAKNDLHLQDYEARYIHGEYGKGTWTFLSGHDPEDYQHLVYAPVTDLGLHPNSPGYRLILNNVLFPAVKTTAVPTVVVNTASSKEAPTGISDNSIPANAIKIYPNPANDELVISYTSGKVDQVTIMDVAGREVFSHAYNDASVSVSVKNFPPGLYLIKANGAYIGKVVKE